MHMTTKILAIGFALGLGLGATTANATTKPTCQHKTDWSKPCSDPVNSEHWTFNNSADAEAWAAAIGIGIGQGGAGGQGGDGGNANQSQDQSQSIRFGDSYAAPAPQASATGWCFTMITGGACVPMKSVQIALRLDIMDRCQAKVGQGAWYEACMHAIAASPQVRKALVDAGLMIKGY